MTPAKKFFLIVGLTLLILLPLQANAQCFDEDGNTLPIGECQKRNLDEIGDTSGYGDTNQDTNLAYKIGQIISYLLAFLGVVFLIIVVYAGIQWMVAGGNPEVVKGARNKLVNAAIGLAIVLAAYAITYLIVSKLQSSLPPSGDISGGCENQSYSYYLYQCVESVNDCDGLIITDAGYECPNNQLCCGTIPQP